MIGGRYGLTKLRGCQQILEIFNGEAAARKLQPFENSEIVSFDSLIPNLGSFFAERTFRTGTSSTPRIDVAAAAGYPVEVVESALKGRLLPMSVCIALKSSVEGLFGAPLPQPFSLREADVGRSPVPVDGGRAAIISLMQQRPI
jgi:hypothetical protein